MLHSINKVYSTCVVFQFMPQNLVFGNSSSHRYNNNYANKIKLQCYPESLHSHSLPLATPTSVTVTGCGVRLTGLILNEHLRYVATHLNFSCRRIIEAAKEMLCSLIHIVEEDWYLYGLSEIIGSKCYY